jgi:hypothetical protein
MNKKATILMIVMIALLAMVIPVLADHNPPDYTYTTAQISTGNAGNECGQLGALLGVEFLYAYKFNEGSGEGAPNQTEMANFYDVDGNLVHSNTIEILESNFTYFDWKATNSIGAVMVKAGQGYNVWYYNPQAFSDTHLFGYEGREVSHVTFCWNPDVNGGDEWCSPGYWRQEHHYGSWEATGYSPDDLFYDALEYYPTLTRQGERAGATTDPTLGQVLNYPQYYGGDSFNAVGDLLSDAHPDVDFTGDRVEDSCPLN